MTNVETETTEQISEVQKSETSVNQILAELVKAQEARITTNEEKVEKRFDEIVALIKEANANPVDSGVEAENKPKTEDSNDVGDKVTVGNEVAPSPHDQASIIAPALEDSKTDTSGLKMENKSDDKVEEKKEEVEKTDDEEDKKEDVKKSEYEIVKTVRPARMVRDDEVEHKTPTGYQILKAIEGGFNGKTSSAEEALTIAYNKLISGEFGNGTPQGAY